MVETWKWGQQFYKYTLARTTQYNGRSRLQPMSTSTTHFAANQYGVSLSQTLFSIDLFRSAISLNSIGGLILWIHLIYIQRVHDLRCCSTAPDGKSKETQTPQLLKIAVGGATELLRLFSPAAPDRWFFLEPCCSFYICFWVWINVNLTIWLELGLIWVEEFMPSVICFLRMEQIYTWLKCISANFWLL